MDQQADDSRPQEAETQVAEPQAPVSLDIFQSIRQAQAQHGLRHSDFKRYRCLFMRCLSLERDFSSNALGSQGLFLYRQYCTRKLQRTRKALKLTHGRGKFQAKKLDVEAVKDSK